jgi:hypothetical protein
MGFSNSFASHAQSFGQTLDDLCFVGKRQGKELMFNFFTSHGDFFYRDAAISVQQELSLFTAIRCLHPDNLLGFLPHRMAAGYVPLFFLRILSHAYYFYCYLLF